MTSLAIGAAIVVALFLAVVAVAGIARLYVWANPEPERRVDAEEGSW